MKARYSWWTDRPRNVTHKEYQQYQFLMMGLFATVFFGMASGASFVMRVLDFLQPKEPVPGMTVQEAASYGQDGAAQRMDIVQLEGYLVADASESMPDEPELKVLRGRLLLEAEVGEGEALVKETFLDWEYQAEEVFLSDGSARVAIAFPLEQLPMKKDFSAKAWVTGGESGSARTQTSKPVMIEYGEDTFAPSEAMKAAAYEAGHSILAEATREYLADGAAVVVQAALEGTPEGGRLVDPLGERLSVELGTAKEIKAGNVKATIFSFLFAIGMMVLAFELEKKRSKVWQEFVARSNS